MYALAPTKHGGVGSADNYRVFHYWLSQSRDFFFQNYDFIFARIEIITRNCTRLQRRCNSTSRKPSTSPAFTLTPASSEAMRLESAVTSHARAFRNWGKRRRGVVSSSEGKSCWSRPFLWRFSASSFSVSAAINSSSDCKQSAISRCSGSVFGSASVAF